MEWKVEKDEVEGFPSLFFPSGFNIRSQEEGDRGSGVWGQRVRGRTGKEGDRGRKQKRTDPVTSNYYATTYRSTMGVVKYPILYIVIATY